MGASFFHPYRQVQLIADKQAFVAFLDPLHGVGIMLAQGDSLPLQFGVVGILENHAVGAWAP